MATEHHQHSMDQNHCRHLFVMPALSFLSMYVLTYAMLNTFVNV